MEPNSESSRDQKLALPQRREWYAIASLVLGILGNANWLPFLIPVFDYLEEARVAPLIGDAVEAVVVGSLTFWFLWGLCSLAGLTLGLKGLHSPRRNFAFTGLMLSLLGLTAFAFLAFALQILQVIRSPRSPVVGEL